MNELEIQKAGADDVHLLLNGTEIKKVSDFSYTKKSAHAPIELTLTIDIDELFEVNTEGVQQ